MAAARLTRRRVLQTTAMTAGGLAAPFLWRVGTANAAAPSGKMVLAWHTNIAARWLDPQQHDGTASPDNFIFALHDGLIKNFRETRYDHPALAQGFEFAEDAKSATFKLRPGTKFHDGSPVTPDDVKFTFEQYRGASAKVLHDKVASIDIPDDRTVRFTFKEPFLDFLVIYGSPASGAAWIVPKAYYEKVGKDGFKNAPIGAGPYRFVRQTAGSEIEFEAFPDYWRKTPSVKTVLVRGVSEAATRLALLQTGAGDVMDQVPGEPLVTVKPAARQRP